MRQVGWMSSLTSAPPTDVATPWWEVVTAVGTLLAVAVAIAVAINEARRARRAERALRDERQQRAAEQRLATAALVTATVERHAEAAPDGTHYIQRSLLRLANESPEPVFNVHLVVARGDPPVPIGPLAAPTPLPLLPARHRRTWDVTLGLLAHGGQVASLGVEPTVEVFFTDVRGVRWHRGFSGELTDSGTSGAKFFQEVGEANEAQLGDLTNPFNPLPVALAFLGALTSTETPPTVEALQILFAPNAPGWTSMTDADLEALGAELREYGVAAHAWYPAPFVAWVRAVHDDDARSDFRPGEFRTVRAKVVTLCFLPSLGWRVFSVGGAMEPDWIGFPPGALSDDPRAVTAVSDEEPIT